MNYTDTYQSVELVLAAGEVPLLIGATGIGKTTLAQELARRNDWSLVAIDGNLLKEGEIGGLPTVEEHTTVYAVHHKLRQIDAELAKGRTVLLFIDEINRCEHAVQQELMNLILNREINGYALSAEVRIIAAMNPAGDYDYQTVEMDAAQENRFVWLKMEPDYLQWLDWAAAVGLEPKVMEFIATFPDYLCFANADDVDATPRSYERISKLYRVYRQQSAVPRKVLLNVICGNVGKVIAEEFVSFIETENAPLLTYQEVFDCPQLSEAIAARVAGETHTRLYLTAKNILQQLEKHLRDGLDDPQAAIDRLMEFIQLYPVDLRIGIMKEIRNNLAAIYKYASKNDKFIDGYFKTYRSIG